MTLLEWVQNQGYDLKTSNSLIKQGKIRINTVIETLPNYKIKPKDKVELIKVKERYVSRGAYKLLAGIDAFNLDFTHATVLDIGSSTGGFTQVCLENGAKKVYAIDVGENQLSYMLRTNEKVIVMEKTNVKTLTIDSFPDTIDFVVSDVSFISLKRVIDVITKILKPQSHFIALIKPQFEANSKDVEPGGFVNESKHLEIINIINAYAKVNGFEYIDHIKSPIKGKNSKNQEYLVHYKRSNYE